MKVRHILVFVILLFVLISGVSATEISEGTDANNLTVTDDVSHEIQDGDALKASDDNILESDVSQNENDLKVSDDGQENNVLESSEDNILKEGESGNWSELRNFIHSSGDTVDIDKDYHYVTHWINSYTIGDRVVTFSNQVNRTIDGHGHTIDFTTDRNNTSAGGRFDLYGCTDMVFKNTIFINIELMNFKSNHTSFINCTFLGINMMSFSCSDSCVLDNCTFDVTGRMEGRPAFGLKGWYDGANDILGGSNNVVSNCRFINLHSSAPTNRGACGGAILFAGGNNTVVNSTFENCTLNSPDLISKIDQINTYPQLSIRTGGGAISFAGPGNKVIGCNFTNSWAKASGGTIYFAQGNNTIDDCNFKIDENIIDVAKTHTSQTGAIYFEGGDANVISNSTFSDMHGCEALIYSNSPINVTGSVFKDNNASKIFDLNSTNNYISDSNFTNNHAVNGGAIYMSDGYVTNCSFVNNTAENDGGAIYSDGHCIVNNCSFVNNTAGENGGAVSFVSTENSHVYNSYFEGNTVENGKGTAIYYENNVGSEDLKNSTFVVSKEKSNLNITIDFQNGLILVEFMPPDDYMYGVTDMANHIEKENLTYLIDGEKFDVTDPQVQKPKVNKTIIVEMYDENMNLIGNATGKTTESGIVDFNGEKLFEDKGAIRYIRAYHPEDKYFKYSETDCYPEVGDFDKLQFYVNRAGDNGVVNLTRNFTYSIGLDTITEGIVINRTNLTIIGNGFTINGLNQSIIFKVLSSGSKLSGITFTNAINSVIYYENDVDALIDNSEFVNNDGIESVISFTDGNLIIDNSKFTHNNCENGAVSFWGRNLTINNTEFVNCNSTYFQSVNGFDEEVQYHHDLAFMYVSSYGKVTLENSKFKGSEFAYYGMYIDANDVKLNNLSFEDNREIQESYYYRRSYDNRLHRYVEVKTKTVIDGSKLSWDSFSRPESSYDLLCIYADNVEISNIKSHNDKVGNFIKVDAHSGCIISNVTASNSNLGSVINVEGNTLIDGVYIDNITSSFKTYTIDYINNKVTENSHEIYPMIKINNAGTYDDIDPDTGSTVQKLWMDDSAVVKNVNVNNIESGHISVIDAYSENVTLDNFNMSDLLCNSTNLISVSSKNSDISNINVEKVEAHEAGNIISLTNYANATLKAIDISDVLIGTGGSSLIRVSTDYGWNEISNHTISVYDVNVENVAPYKFNSTYDDGYWEYYRQGVYPLRLVDSFAKTDVANVSVDNCYISNAVYIRANDLNVSDIIVKDSNSSLGNALNVISDNDLTLKDISIENMDVLPYRYMYSYVDSATGDRIYYAEDWIPDAGSGITASANGNLYMSNINLTNSKSVTSRLLNVGANGNVTVQDVNVLNVVDTGLTAVKSDGSSLSYEDYSGVSANSLAIASMNGTVIISNFNVDGVSSGIGDAKVYTANYINVTGVDVVIDDLTINNAAIGGFIGNDMNAKTVSIVANNNVDIKNLLFNNITQATPFSHNYYNTQIGKTVSETYIPNGNAGIFIEGNATTLTNINITNTLGGSQYGSLNIQAGNATVKDIVIDNITTARAELRYYDKDIGRQTYDYNKYIKYNSSNDEYSIESVNYYYSAPGISVSADNAVIDNINITDCNYAADIGEEMMLIKVEVNDNGTLSNINIKNITEKLGIEIDSDTGREKTVTGRINPSIYLESQMGNINVYNMSIDSLEHSAQGEFFTLSSDNANLENISIMDSKIGGMSYSIEVDVQNNLNVENFVVDKIYKPIPENETSYVNYYDKYGSLIFSQSNYEVDCYATFTIMLSAGNDVSISDMNITNVDEGGMDGNVYISGANVVADNILLENISASGSYNEYFSTQFQKYLVDNRSDYNGGISIYSSENLTLSNLNLNNIDVVSQYVVQVSCENANMDNITISNLNPIPQITKDWDENGNEYIRYMMYMQMSEIASISANDQLNINNLNVDNVPCTEETIYIDSKNAHISNSTFKNMVSGSFEYRYNETSKELQLYRYSNEGNVIYIYATNVAFSNDLFENITGNGNAIFMECEMGVIDNCTFRDVNSLTGHDYRLDEGYDWQTGQQYVNVYNYTYESEGSAIGFSSTNPVNITNSHFINCSADYGGALYVKSPVNIIESDFTECDAKYGGAIYFSNNIYDFTVQNSIFIENTAEFNGGAIYMEEADDGKRVINVSTFIGNHANHDGGAFLYNNTIDKLFFDDYQWFNRTAMFSDGKLNYAQHNTQIIDSLFENNTDHELRIIADNVGENENQTIIIILPSDCDGQVTVNVTDENGNFVYDLMGNEIKNMNYTLVNGTASIPLGILPGGKYNVSAYHDNYNSEYSKYHDYGYRYNATSFSVYGNFLNVTVLNGENPIYADENVTIRAKLNNLTVGTVTITISNGTDNLTFSDVPIVNGTAVYNVSGIWAGKYNVTVTYGKEHNQISNTTNFTVIQRNSVFDNVTVKDNVYGNTTKITVAVPQNQTGNVTVSINNQTYTKEVINGTVEFEIPGLTAGDWEANVTFEENRVYAENTTLFKFNVAKANLTANATVLNENMTVHDNPTFLIDVPADFTGNVTIKVGNETLYDGPANAVISIDSLPSGNYTANITFYGDDNYGDAKIQSNFTIKSSYDKKDSLVNVTATNSVFGGYSIVTVNVPKSQSGHVLIEINNVTYASEIKQGVAVFNVTGLDVGNYSVGVTYLGDEIYGKQFNETSFNVTQATLNPSVISLNVTVVDNASFIITNISDFKGKVNITVDGETYTRDISSIVNIPNLTEGSKQASLVFYGDKNYDELQLDVNFTVSRVSTTLDVIVDEVTYPDNATAIIRVSGNANGTVVVIVNGKEYPVKEVINGYASVDLGILGAGIKNITANFKVSDNINSNATGTSNFVVDKMESAVNITVSGNNVTVNVTKGGNGNLTVYVNGVKKDLVYKGEAIVLVNALTIGNNTIVAIYGGNENYTSSQADKDIVIAGKSSFVNVTADEVTFGSDAVVVVNVGDGQTGYVTINVGGKDYTAKINGTQVIFTVPGLNVASYPVTVTYSGDSVFANETNSTELIIKKANLTATVEGRNVNVAENASFILNNIPGGFKGKVNITVDGNTYTRDINSIVEISKLVAGDKTANVIFYGDENYGVLELNATFTVSRMATDLNVTVENVKYPNNATAVIRVSGNANGTVVVTINGIEYPAVNVENGYAEVNLTGLSAGVKDVFANFTSNDLINQNATGNTKFVVMKAESILNIETHGNNVTVTVPSEATGNISVYVNGIEYVREIDNGKVVVENVLAPGNNSVIAVYGGNDNFSSAVNNTKVNVPVTKVNTTLVIYNETRDVVVSFPSGATGNVTIYVNGEKFIRGINNGKAVVENVLKPGHNSVIAIYEGNDYSGGNNFTDAYNATDFVLDGENKNPFNVTVKDLISSENLVIINVTGEYDGNVTVIVDNGEKIIQPLENGVTVFYLKGLSTDKHNIVVTCPDGSVSHIDLDAKGQGATIDILTIKAENMKRGYNSPYDYQAAFLDANGNALVNTEVIFKVNGKEYKVKTNGSGIAQLKTAKLPVGTYNITSINVVTGEQTTNNLTIVKRILENKDLTMDFTDGSKFVVKVIGDDGNIAPEGEIIDITANGVHYASKVGKKGYASLTINLLPKKYKLTAEYKGFKTTNKLVVKQILKAVKKTTKVKKGKKLVLKAKLKWSNGKAIKGKVIKFKLKGKTYKAKTNKKGIAKVTIKKKVTKKFKKGKKYKVTISYDLKYKYGDAYQISSDKVKCYVKVKK